MTFAAVYTLVLAAAPRLVSGTVTRAIHASRVLCVPAGTFTCTCTFRVRRSVADGESQADVSRRVLLHQAVTCVTYLFSSMHGLWGLVPWQRVM